jgi:ketosteroid isomerase-like protein
MLTPGRRLIEAFLAGDTPAAVDLLAPQATFHSPIRDYAGRDEIRSVWGAVASVVETATPTSVHEHAGETIAFFTGAIKAQPIDGVMRTITDDDDRVADIMLMIRPWAALRAGIADVKL